MTTDGTTGGRTLGARIRLARRIAGFSLEDLGDALQVSRSAVSQWEENQTLPRQEHMDIISEVLRVSLDWLAKGKGKGPKTTVQDNGGYRREVIGKMQRLIATGKFDHVLLKLGYRHVGPKHKK